MPFFTGDTPQEFRIRLRRFDHSDPTLHEVFVTLVGPEAREASLR